MHDTIIVFTRKSLDRMVSEGGSASWRLDRKKALDCDYVICTRHAKAEDVEGWEDGYSAFLIGKISGIEPAPGSPIEDNRFIIRFSEFAPLNIPNVWIKGDRNPIRYTSLDSLGIDVANLAFQPVPPAPPSPQSKGGEGAEEAAPMHEGPAHRPLTMDEAKKGLAMTFGVKPEAIEITIRG